MSDTDNMPALPAPASQVVFNESKGYTWDAYTADQIREFGNQQFNAGRQFEAERRAGMAADRFAPKPTGPAPILAEQHFKLSDHEIEHLRTNPHALDLLMNYHDARQAEADAFFDGADIGTTGNKLRRQALYERGRSLMAEDLDVWPDDLRTAFGFPVCAPAATKTDTGWLQLGGFLYRLTDDKRPVNRDQIAVTMADGSVTVEACARRAGELLDLINGAAGAAANKETP